MKQIQTIITILVLFSFAIATAFFCSWLLDTSTNKLLNEKRWVVTEVFCKSNQFVINGDYVMDIEKPTVEVGCDDVLEIKDIVSSDYNGRVNVQFHNSDVGYVQCNISIYLPDKRRKQEDK